MSTPSVQFRFRRCDTWHYPAGLERELTAQLAQQGVHIVAATTDSSTVYIEFNGTIWTLTDTGGELTVAYVNGGIVTAIVTSGNAMPSDVFEYAMLLLMRIMTALNTQPHIAADAWDALERTPSYAQRDLRNIPMFAEAHGDAYLRVAESVASGDLTQMPSCQLDMDASAQLDAQTGTLLIATNEEQFLLSAGATQALLCFLYDNRDAIGGDK